MCNIAGYAGSKPAAPILIDMLRREEGWAGGYYTGIATIHEGKIHYAKLTGTLDDLLAKTDAASLPGTVGIIHSRSKSGGDDKWAHPFLGGREEITTAYVANGYPGIFDRRKNEFSGIAAELEADGYILRSRDPDTEGYFRLPDGSYAHMSDVMAQLITRRIDSGASAAGAMNDSFCEMPGEIVGLLLSLSEPDSIAWSRISMPMFIGFASHGAYLATTAQAFPEDAGEPLLLPACSGGNVYPDHFTCAPYKNPPCTVAPMTAQVIADACVEVEKALSEGPHAVGELAKLVRPLFSEADCVPFDPLVYVALFSLQQQGRLAVTVAHRPGAREDLTAPQFLAGLK